MKTFSQLIFQQDRGGVDLGAKQVCDYFPRELPGKSKYCSRRWIDFKLVFIVGNLIKDLSLRTCLIGLNVSRLCGKFNFPGRFFKNFSAEGDISGLLIASMIYHNRGEGHAHDF
jgi:hypothetical protein